MSPQRVLVLPARGRLLVSTDLHGNREDLLALRACFLEARARGEDAHWALLGDLVHGPSEEARAYQPELYDYPDRSAELPGLVLEAARAHPGRVHYVLGNHDYGHLGGPRPGKFHDDEVAFLERGCTAAQLAELAELFSGALLALVAPCGALLCHGSPDAQLPALAELGALPLPPPPRHPAHRALQGLLYAYGQPAGVTAALLGRLSAELGLPLTMVVHGHDRDEGGWYVDGGNQCQPVIFGAPRQQKRYLWLDLAARYPGPGALREGHELRRLYPASGLG